MLYIFFFAPCKSREIKRGKGKDIYTKYYKHCKGAAHIRNWLGSGRLAFESMVMNLRKITNYTFE
jgi:hypothetical protein